MYDPRRLLGPLTALAALVAALAVAGLGLAPALGGRPRWVPEVDSTVDLVEFQRLAGRLAGVIRGGLAPGGPGPAPGGGRLGVLLGSSSLEWGVDPKLLPAELRRRPIRWLCLNNSGSNGIDLRRMGRYMVQAGLRPEVVVLALGPASLARGNDPLDDPTTLDPEPFRRHLAGRNPMLLKEDLERALLVPWNRAFPNRTRIGHHVRDLLFDARLRLFAALGYGVESLYPPDPDPWSATPWWARGDRAPPAIIDQQMEGMRKYGMFDPAQYEADGQNARSLVGLIAELRRAGAEVVVAFMPEAERRRRELPPEALRTFDQALGRGFGPSAPPVLDLRASIPEGGFFDPSHLNPAGRAAFTDRLGRALLDLLDRPGPTGRPPRAGSGGETAPDPQGRPPAPR